MLAVGKPYWVHRPGKASKLPLHFSILLTTVGFWNRKDTTFAGGRKACSSPCLWLWHFIDHKNLFMWPQCSWHVSSSDAGLFQADCFSVIQCQTKDILHHLSLLQTVVHLCTLISIYLAEGLITEYAMKKCGSSYIPEEGELGGTVKYIAFKSPVFFYIVL